MRLVYLLLLFLLLPLAVAFAPSTPSQIIWTCLSGTQTSCASDISCTIDIFYPGNNSIFVTGKLANKTNSYYYYNFTTPTVIGSYNYIVTCFNTSTGYYGQIPSSFKVSPGDVEYSTAQSLIYIAVLIVLILFFGLSLYFAVTIEWGNFKQEEDPMYLDRINWSKYLKFLAVGISYACLVGIIFFSWNVSQAFLQFQSLTDFLGYLFRVVMMPTKLIIVVAFIVLIISFFRDLILNGKITRGITVHS
jgi:hypothetical protein